MTFLLLIFFLFTTADAAEFYYNYNNKIQRCINPQIKANWNVQGGMCGGQLSPNLKKISMAYWSDETPSKERARELYIDIIEYVLYVYNSNEVIRPYLDKYPYTPENVDVTIFFLNVHDIGEVHTVGNFGNRINYAREGENKYQKTDLELENFSDAFKLVRGKEWDPYKYGYCSDKGID